MVEFEYLKQLVEQAQKDMESFQGGNKSAGVRLRKAMQDVRKTAAAIRVKVLEEIKQRTAAKKDAQPSQEPPTQAGPTA